MRKLNAKRAGAFIFAAFALWFLNYNSALQRYDDLIAACNFTKQQVYAPVTGWADADLQYLSEVLVASSVKQDVKTAADVKIDRLHATIQSLRFVVAKPCEDRFQAPGVFG